MIFLSVPHVDKLSIPHTKRRFLFIRHIENVTIYVIDNLFWSILGTEKNIFV